ncbi:hypothetical protein B296_00025968 [Ensete ventricosum]|uniref:Amino acid transporter transmembrane domain-containing protein n=1 Tax=Ensete ventricosum TaxID=4639 RepID=A0A426ZVX3_ENSVE|nr:hypothetical protein B296_00025968 [Ensete ventricosum]
MYKGVSAAYSIILLSYWQLAFSGYWAFGSQVQLFILSSLTIPEWTIVMANVFAVIQISGCFQVLHFWDCHLLTYTYFKERMLSNVSSDSVRLRNCLWRLAFASMPFFGDFVSICGAIGFTPLDFVFPALAFLKAGRMPKNARLRLVMHVLLHLTIAAWFSIVAVVGCIGAVRFIVIDVKTYKFFHDM